MTWHYLDLADFLIIAEAVLDIDAQRLVSMSRVDLAESALHAPAAEFDGVEFHEGLARKTAVLALRLIKNHPLPDGNKRVGYLCALEFVARNGGRWTPPAADHPDGDETVATIEGVAAGTIDADMLTTWIEQRLADD